MSWQRLILSIPVELTETGNKLAHVLDPDTGGAKTFGRVIDGERTLCCTLISPEYVQAMASPETMHAALVSLAASRGREAPTLGDCQALYDGMDFRRIENG